MERAILCQVLGTTLRYLRVAVTCSRALDMTSHTTTLPLSTFLRQSARVEREIPVNKRLCGLTVTAASAVSRLSRFPQIFPSSLFLILISLISATGRSGVESWQAPCRQLLHCPFCLAAEGRRFGSVKWQPPLNLMRSCGPVLIGEDEEEGKRRGGKRRLQMEIRESNIFPLCRGHLGKVLVS